VLPRRLGDMSSRGARAGRSPCCSPERVSGIAGPWRGEAPEVRGWPCCPPRGPCFGGRAGWGRGGQSGSTTASLPACTIASWLDQPILRFLTTKHGLDKPPPIAERISVTQTTKEIKATYLGGVLHPQKPTSTGDPPIHVPLQRRDPPSALPCCLPETRANLSDLPNEGR